MRAASTCNSIMQAPRCRIYSLANIWLGSFDRSKVCKDSYTSPLQYSTVCGLGGHSGKWSRRPITTNTEVGSVSYKSGIKPGISDGIVTKTTKLTINKVENTGINRVEHDNIQQLIAENKDLDLNSLVTFIVFDIETTGFKREEARIIEIAVQDLRGGQNSTFQSLINPGCYVPNQRVHGITTRMVCKSGVPRMDELIPIFVRYIESRQKPGGHVVIVAHNARSFDIPILINEFRRYNHEIPPNWLFLDTLALARELMKAGGTNPPTNAKLQVLREHYGIPIVGSAHRAMSDVYALAHVLQRMTYDLKIPVRGLVERCFTVSDLLAKKKKSR